MIGLNRRGPIFWDPGPIFEFNMKIHQCGTDFNLIWSGLTVAFPTVRKRLCSVYEDLIV